MDTNTLQQLRAIPVEGVAGRLGLEVTRHKALCPFHDDHHASLAFNPARNTFRCWACGEHGGVIDLVMRRLGKDFLEACRWLDGNATLMPQTPPASPASQPAFDAARYARYFEHPWLSPAARRFLFGERRLDPRVISWCRLTSWTDRGGTEWLQIPYRDPSGRLTGVQNRCLTPGAGPRFRFPKGSVCGIYNLPVTALLRPAEPLYIAEGCSDCWALLSAGHKAVAVPSATLLKSAAVRLLEDLAHRLGTPFHIYPDNDAPGEALCLRLQQLLPSVERHPLPSGCKDFADYYRQRKEAADA